MDEFNVELKTLLQTTLVWSEEFKNKNLDYSFDIDDNIYKLAKKHNKDFKQGDLILLYNLLDFYCDAIKHGFREIDKNYSIIQAESDVKAILNALENNRGLGFPNEIKDRLKRL